MPQSTPPLHLLKIFAAAADRESFKVAGEDLHLTASAVSHQVKALEEWLGLELFLRVNRGVKLTQAGKDYYQVVGKLFKTLEKGTQQLLADHNRPSMKVSVMPSLANNIIFPKIDAFEQQHPELQLDIESSDALVDFLHSEIDLAFRFGKGDWPGTSSRRIMDVTVVLVCSPEFAQNNDLSNISALNEVTLISLKNYPKIWQRVAEGFKVPPFENRRQRVYQTYDSGVQAALNGLGVSIAVTELESVLIDEGRLIQLFGMKMPISEGLYALWRAGEEPDRYVESFITWVDSICC